MEFLELNSTNCSHLTVYKQMINIEINYLC